MKVPEYITSTFFRQLWRDIFIEGLDATILIHGRKRKGKSTIALKILELLNVMQMKEKGLPIDYDKIVQDRVFYRVGKFAKAIGSARRKGMVLILDEAGVDASNLKWWDSTVKALRDIMHVDGIRHLILIIVLPQKMHFAKGTRDMINIEIKALKADKRKRKTHCRVKYYGLIEDPNKDRGIYPRTMQGHRITRMTLSAPDQGLIDAYKRIEHPAKEKIIKEKVDEIVQADPKNQTTLSVKPEFDTVLKGVLKDLKRYVTKRSLRKSLIERDFGVSDPIARQLREKIEVDYANALNDARNELYGV